MSSVPVIESPCIKQCELDLNREYCVSCLRSVEQITNWRYYTPEQRQQIINTLRR